MPNTNRPARWAAGAVLCALAVSGGACRKKDARVVAGSPRVEINGHTWLVECAATRAERFIGMAGRRRLAAGAGMLFIYPAAQVLDFCMRGCEIPLDIAFIGADMRVVAIYTMSVEPDRLGRKTYSSVVPARYALEAPAGAFGRAGVQVGHKAKFTGNIPPAAKAEPQQ